MLSSAHPPNNTQKSILLSFCSNHSALSASTGVTKQGPQGARALRNMQEALECLLIVNTTSFASRNHSGSCTMSPMDSSKRD